MAELSNHVTPPCLCSSKVNGSHLLPLPPKNEGEPLTLGHWVSSPPGIRWEKKGPNILCPKTFECRGYGQ